MIKTIHLVDTLYCTHGDDLDFYILSITKDNQLCVVDKKNDHEYLIEVYEELSD